MPKKIRIIFIVIGLVAIFAVFKFASYVHAVANRGSGIPEETVLPSPEQDSDHDGLSNQQEIIWNTDPFNPDTDGDGYKDGEEINSGHNPLVPGPDDPLSTSSDENITEKLSTLIVSGIYAGDLSNNADATTYSQAVATIGSQILYDTQVALNTEPAPVGIKISNNSKQSQEQYLTSLAAIIEDIWGELINEPQQVVAQFPSVVETGDSQKTTSAETFFNTKQKYYEAKLAELRALPVPPAWADIHKQAIADLESLRINHEALGQLNQDPIKAITAMSNIMSLYQNIRPLLTAMTEQVKSSGLNPPDGQLWKLIEILTNGI